MGEDPSAGPPQLPPRVCRGGFKTQRPNSRPSAGSTTWVFRVFPPSTVYSKASSVAEALQTDSLVRCSSSRYLFNCGEGVQRLMQEHK